jgi:glycosyltransferase involved in cell wall biosynthesis
LKREYGIPYALVTHGDIFDRPPGTYDLALTWLYKLTTPVAYRHAALIVALSPHMARCALARGARPSAVSVIPNGIDPSELARSGGPAGERAPSLGIRLLFVGRLAVEKGVDVLLDACAILGRLGLDFHLKVAGDGPRQSSLRARARMLGLDSLVDFSGQVSRSALGATYREADIVCVPSLNDPLPTVVLEAMAAGCCIVASAVGGIPFLLESGVNGALVPPGEPQRLADTIRSLADDRGLRSAMGSRAQATAAERFSWEAIGRQLCDAVDNMISAAHA